MNMSPRSLLLIASCLLGAALVSPPRLAESQAESLVTSFGQPAWVLRNAEVELTLTQQGGHMAPVTFYRGTSRPVQPYYISPWQEENVRPETPVLVPLRGDFFCAPFGGNAEPYRGEQHTPHGEPATARWSFERAGKSGSITAITVSMQTRVRPGKVTKRLMLVDGQNVVYSQNVLEGFTGEMPLGHHATLAVPEEAGALRISTSPFRFGMTAPGVFSDPGNREYQSFAAGKRFQDLRRVPLAWKKPATGDASSFPQRTGYTDLLAVFSKPRRGEPSWTAAANPQAGYLWFSLKDPEVLPSTVFWIANRGRHGSPWNGRNRCLGLEDVCAYFAEGLVPSVTPNELNKAGIPTAVKLSPSRPTVINYIQGVVKIPADFDRVKKATFEPGQVTFTSVSGKVVTAPVNHDFLKTGRL
jgi:hypothetical protein